MNAPHPGGRADWELKTLALGLYEVPQQAKLTDDEKIRTLAASSGCRQGLTGVGALSGGWEIPLADKGGVHRCLLTLQLSERYT